jgi:hypothetical protein
MTAHVQPPAKLESVSVCQSKSNAGTTRALRAIFLAAPQQTK